MEALLQRFQAAHTQVLGVSIDSVYSHANWGRDLGGVSFPLLSDFEAKGAVAQRFGVYLDGPGITDRATILIDSGGVVRHASSATPAGSGTSRNLPRSAKPLTKRRTQRRRISSRHRVFQRARFSTSRASAGFRRRHFWHETTSVSEINSKSGMSARTPRPVRSWRKLAEKIRPRVWSRAEARSTSPVRS